MDSALSSRARPSFFGLVGGGLLKLSRQWMTWIILVLYLGGTALLFLLLDSGGNEKEILQKDPLNFLYTMTAYPATVMRIFGGFFLMIITAYLVGMEYQGGTIRVVLARGVGRVQFFLAQLTTALLVVIMLFVGWTLINLAGLFVSVLILGGRPDIFTVADSTYWREMGIYMLTILMSMTVSVLMAATMAVIGRSLAFGMSAALSWFPIDNIAIIPLTLIAQFLHRDWPRNATGYLLGPVVNGLPEELGLKNIGPTGLLAPVVKVESTQALLVVLAYAVAFLVISLLLTWKKDVKE